MQHLILKQLPVKLALLALLCLSASAFAPGAGLDSFEIYLNSRLLVKQAVNEPVSLNRLPLEEARAGDLLVIRYRHCGGVAGRNRSISIRNEQGQVLKQWKFGDAGSGNDDMQVPVKELQQLQKEHQGRLDVYYTSAQLPRGQMLAGLQAGGKGKA